MNPKQRKLGMILLIDLDGTLTDTAHENFKPFKDGLQETAPRYSEWVVV